MYSHPLWTFFFFNVLYCNNAFADKNSSQCCVPLFVFITPLQGIVHNIVHTLPWTMSGEGGLHKNIGPTFGWDTAERNMHWRTCSNQGPNGWVCTEIYILTTVIQLHLASSSLISELCFCVLQTPGVGGIETREWSIPWTCGMEQKT